jgi:ankyrin repeat protein
LRVNTKLTLAVLPRLPAAMQTRRMPNNRRTFLMQSAAAAGMLHAQTAGPAKPDIFQAASAGDVPRATELIEANSEIVRSRAADGRTPLHYATAAGKAEMTTFLISKGAVIDAGPEPPLLAAIDCPDHAAASEMAFFMLCNAADPNARRGGRTALQIAQARGYDDIAHMLIHRGAVSDDQTIERVHFARRYPKNFRENPEGLSWTQINPFVTLSHFNFAKVKELLQATPGLLNARASWDELPVEAAAHTGQFEMAEWLVEKGALVSTCTAVLLGQAGSVKEALAADRLCIHERGAHDIAILAYTGYAREQAAIAEMLLKAGADVHSLSFSHTALHLAASKGYIELAEVLLHYNADVNAIATARNTKVTPLDLAIRGKQPKMEEFLRERGAK